MQLSELKLVFASNLIRLRGKAGMTQAELGAMLNYSDKSVSKWERGEAIPDAWVLTRVAEIFGVTVDFLLSSHDAWTPPEAEEERPQYSRGMICAVAVLAVWTMALIAFVVLWWVGVLWWPVFAVALTVSLLALMILSVWFRWKRNLQYIIAGFVLSVFVLLYVLMLPWRNNWQLFLIAAPSVALVFLGCNIRKRPRKTAG